MIKCSRFLKCDAPICPEDNPEDKIWYPTEAICSNPEYSQLQYIITQKKIKKKAINTNRPFTFKMLNRDIIVKAGITGIEADKFSKAQEDKWIKMHPIKKPMSAEHKKKVSKHLAEYLKLKKKTASSREK